MTAWILMGPSRADDRSGVADNVTGYLGSGSKIVTLLLALTKAREVIG